MWTWVGNHIGWFVIRCSVTIMGCLIVNTVISSLGYRTDFSNILLIAVCLIVVVRFWLPKPLSKEE